MESVQQEVDNIRAKYEQSIINLSDRIWEIAETRFQEHQSVELLTGYLREMGFHVEVGIGGLETAFVAKYGSTGPVIGILGEYDALPGLNQKPGTPIRDAFVNGANGHGCGHNLLGTAGIAAVMIIKELIDQGSVNGQIHYYGCPAEEGGSGKTFMVREGVFNDVDLALTWHPNSFTGIFSFSSLANYQVSFEFEGIASHAANSPDLGRSALDAVEIMSVGVNYLREHIPTSAKLHYAVTNTGGRSPNVVQSQAEVLYLIRGKDIAEVDDVYKRVVKIAEGAALMTETKVKVKFDKACSNYLPNDTLNKVVFKNLQKVGLPSYNEEELKYAKEMVATLSPNEIASAKQEVKKLAGSMEDTLRIDDLTTPFFEEIIPYEQSKLTMAGSTDVADVSWVVPTAQFFTTCFVFGTPLHTWQLVSQGKTSLAHKGLLYAGEVLALSAIELFENPELIIEAKKELLEQTKGQYVNPIPPMIKPNALGEA
ncbi:MAG: M20 family metallopeptidase [Solibacillus sp.]|uniref:M20 family metallopeptidase n=1 Tax=unclassified Solibacillus TaxID=2637870 RepID=UPI0030F581B2